MITMKRKNIVGCVVLIYGVILILSLNDGAQSFSTDRNSLTSSWPHHHRRGNWHINNRSKVNRKRIPFSKRSKKIAPRNGGRRDQIMLPSIFEQIVFQTVVPPPDHSVYSANIKKNVKNIASGETSLQKLYKAERIKKTSTTTAWPPQRLIYDNKVVAGNNESIIELPHHSETGDDTELPEIRPSIKPTNTLPIDETSDVTDGVSSPTETREENTADFINLDII